MNRDDVNLSEYFYYDETSPSSLRWKAVLYSGGHGRGRQMTEIGGVAGTSHNKAGYAVVGLLGVTWLVHKAIWQMKTKEPYSSFQVDHENGVVTDNKISNLRKASQRSNMQNRRLSSANSSGVAGVDKVTNKGNTYWRARCYSLELAACGKRGKEKVKRFNVGLMGDAEAFNAACEYRAKMIEQLNVQGADYKERHGG